MKKTLILLILAFVCLSQASSFEGLWYTKGKESIVRIWKRGDTFEGKIVWLKDSLDAQGRPQMDTNNPNRKLRQRGIQNLTILKNFRFSKGSLKKGKIYDPSSGKTYNCTMKIKNQNLEVHGYVGVSLLGRTEKWERCENVPHP